MPQPEEEYKYEKVAFRGQVPVFVTGAVNIGDYILPSQNNDGLAIAICPEEMRVQDFKHIIGVAWSSADYSPMNLVNVAIGINSNDLGDKLDELDQKVSNILDYLQGNGTLEDLDQVQVKPKDEAVARTAPVSSPFQKALTDEEFDQILDAYEPMIDDLFVKVKKSITEHGYDLEKYPEIQEFLDDPIPFMKEVRRNPDYLTQWASIDRNFQHALQKND
jgi:hypothetical protein